MSRNIAKDIKIVLDLDIVNTNYGSDLLPFLLKSGHSYEVISKTIKNSITVIRQLNNPVINDIGETVMTKEEPFCILVWDCDTIMPLIKRKQLLTTVKEMIKTIPDVKIILALCGVSNYFRTTKEQFKAKSSRNPNIERPVNRREFEWSLTELQLLINVDHRVLNTSDEFCNFIKQYVKSITEIPYKLERYEKDLLTDGCIVGERVESVTVSKGHGFSRLFKQQLMQFTRTTFEIAEAIINTYPTQKSLMEAYGECSVNEGLILLSNLQIRRSKGPLAKSRNIGPEISKRIYRFYTSVDGMIDIDE